MEFCNTDFLQSDEIYLRLTETTEANPAEDLVPSYRFEIVRSGDHVKVGYCDLRIGHNERLYYGGNIGYGVDEAYRGNHYAAKACRLLFRLAEKHDLEYVIITCNPDNLPSKRTCEFLGGELLEIAELPSENDMRADGATEKCIFRFNLP